MAGVWLVHEVDTDLLQEVVLDVDEPRLERDEDSDRTPEGLEQLLDLAVGLGRLADDEHAAGDLDRAAVFGRLAELAVHEVAQLVRVDARAGVLLVRVGAAERQHAARHAAALAARALVLGQAELGAGEVGRLVDDVGDVVEVEEKLLLLRALVRDQNDAVLDHVDQLVLGREDQVERVLTRDVAEIEG